MMAVSRRDGRRFEHEMKRVSSRTQETDREKEKIDDERMARRVPTYYAVQRGNSSAESRRLWVGW